MVEYEIVLADGTVKYVTGCSDPDLFWALKGGSSNFGIVTKFKLNTFVSTQVLAGVYSVADIPAFLAATKLVYDACLQEPECLFYHVGRLDSIQPTWLTELPEGSDEDEECVITFSEGWNCTLEWYKEVQFRKDYYGPHMEVAKRVWTKPRELQSFFLPYLLAFID